MEVNGYEWRGKKVLVTGASGFKGGWMCAALLEMGATVYATLRDRAHPDSVFRLLDLEDRVSAVKLDISDRQAVLEAVATIEPDAIFHLAFASAFAAVF